MIIKLKTFTQLSCKLLIIGGFFSYTMINVYNMKLYVFIIMYNIIVKHKIILTFNNSYLIECKPKGIVLAARVICAIEFYSHSISAKSCAINHHANAASKTRIIAGTR